MPAYVSTGDEARDKMIHALLERFSLSPNIRLNVCGESGRSASEMLGAASDCTIVISEVPCSGSEEFSGSPATDAPGSRLFFLSEPFAIEDFFALLRRAATPVGEKIVEDAKLEFDRAARAVRRGSVSVTLSAKEAELFGLLFERVGSIVSKETIYDRIWPGEVRSNMADVYICYLRRKLSPVLDDGAIVSLRGRGYMLKL